MLSHPLISFAAGELPVGMHNSSGWFLAGAKWGLRDVRGEPEPGHQDGFQGPHNPNPRARSMFCKHHRGLAIQDAAKHRAPEWDFNLRFAFIEKELNHGFFFLVVDSEVVQTTPTQPSDLGHRTIANTASDNPLRDAARLQLVCQGKVMNAIDVF
jgi:hypothetical protein